MCVLLVKHQRVFSSTSGVMFRHNFIYLESLDSGFSRVVFSFIVIEYVCVTTSN